MSASVVDPRFHVPPRRVIALLVFAAAVFWFARPVMLPFVVGAIIAYAFSPAIDSVRARTGRSRLLIVAALYGFGLAWSWRWSPSPSLYRGRSPSDRERPDALETALRQVLGSDSVTIGDLTLTVEQIAAQPKTAINAYLQTPEGALRAAEQLLHGTLDVILTMLVTFFLLLDGGKFGEAALRFLDPADRVQMRQVATRDPRRRRPVASGPAGPVVLVAVVVSIVLGPILHMPNPAALGLMVGLLEVITFIGPILAGAIVGIVASQRAARRWRSSQSCSCSPSASSKTSC